MDRILQWAWDRHQAVYSWAWMAVAFVAALPIYLFLSFAVVASEHSRGYSSAAFAAGIVVLMVAYVVILPGQGVWRSLREWSKGCVIDTAQVLEETYTYSRRVIGRSLATIVVGAGLLLLVVASLAGQSGSRLVHYALAGCVAGFASHLVGVHTLAEAPMRPVRIALADLTDHGDALPRPRPSFATWTRLSMLAAAMSFAFSGAILTTIFVGTVEAPLLWILVGLVLTVIFGFPITVGAAFAPSLQPIRDLAEGTKRVAAG
ncbi:hypothetical protein MCNF_36530 [Mycolicibacterium confluentis]|uniref:Uncharacterized protein n=1 Tax=Mycolicibacterium confluentis TaxID=28047 RepID=A0A7I7Y098_9MYCO|nr:hypothetical protein MCNF_36530 [Mycolicibacterium confluentis]